MDQIQQFIEQIRELLIAISGSFAVIGVLGLAFMYLGSSLPLVSDWKQNNPKAFNNVAIGLGLVVFAAGGGVLTLVGQ
ncbi:MAG: hypothetical protein JXB30_04675 [Anaerolineae bacterium]|nr:hypothetical protein [Anaerolineae bacterium]